MYSKAPVRLAAVRKPGNGEIDCLVETALRLQVCLYLGLTSESLSQAPEM
jgi:hypothetical protein